MPPPKENKLANPSAKKQKELLEKTSAGVMARMPDAKPNKVRPYNAFEKFFMGGDTGGLTYPNNTVAINMERAQNPDDMIDLLVHEFTHTKQKPRSLWQAYKERKIPVSQRPAEREAEVASLKYPYRPKGRDTQLR